MVNFSNNPVEIVEVGTAAVEQGRVIDVVIEVDIGLRRAGVPPGAAAVRLASAVAQLPGLRLRGVVGWEGQATRIADPPSKTDAVRTAVASLVDSADRCRAAGFPIDIVSCGGTGTVEISAAQPGVTEIQAGGGTLGDRRYTTVMGFGGGCALGVLSTVTSRPNARRVITDAGVKSMSRDGAEPRARGLPVDSVRLSAEHCAVVLSTPCRTPLIGDRVLVEPGNADQTMNLHTRVWPYRGADHESPFDLPPRQ